MLVRYFHSCFAALALVCLGAPSIHAETTVIVPGASIASPVDTGVFAQAGQRLNVSASGLVNLASFDGSYITNPDGVIVVAPAANSGANFYFTYALSPSGTPPSVGTVKTIDSTGLPVGALLGAFSSQGAPPLSSFFLVGSNSVITAPSGGGELYLIASDVDPSSFFDNSGSFTAAISTPEPGSWMAMGIGGLCLFAYGLRRRRDTIASV